MDSLDLHEGKKENIVKKKVFEKTKINKIERPSPKWTQPNSLLTKKVSWISNF